MSGNPSTAWSDEAFGGTEFLQADYRDFVFPPHLHETFAIGVIEAGGQRFRPGRASALVMPAGTLCAIDPGVVHEGRPATEQGWRYRMFYPSPALVAGTLEHPQRGPRVANGASATLIYGDRDAALVSVSASWHFDVELGAICNAAHAERAATCA